MKPPFHKVENSWQYTTIYDADDKPICRFDLEDIGDVTEDNQDELDKVMQKRVDHVLALLNVQGEK